MGLNWAVNLLGLFAGTIAGTLYMLLIVILANLSGFLVKSSLFIRACIGHYREVHCLFDSSLRELVLPSVSIIPGEFQVNPSNIVNILAANTERNG